MRTRPRTLHREVVLCAVLLFPPCLALGEGGGAGGGKGKPTSHAGHQHHHHSNVASGLLGQALTNALVNPLDDSRRANLRQALDRVAATTVKFNAAAQDGNINPNDVAPMQKSLANTLNQNVKETERRSTTNAAANSSSSPNTGNTPETSRERSPAPPGHARESVEFKEGQKPISSSELVTLGRNAGARKTVASDSRDEQLARQPGSATSGATLLVVRSNVESGTSDASGNEGRLGKDAERNSSVFGSQDDDGDEGVDALDLLSPEGLDRLVLRKGVAESPEGEDALSPSQRRRAQEGSRKGVARKSSSSSGRLRAREGSLAAMIIPDMDGSGEIDIIDSIIVTIPLSLLLILAFAAWARLTSRYARTVYAPAPPRRREDDDAEYAR